MMRICNTAKNVAEPHANGANSPKRSQTTSRNKAQEKRISPKAAEIKTHREVSPFIPPVCKQAVVYRVRPIALINYWA